MGRRTKRFSLIAFTTAFVFVAVKAPSAWSATHPCFGAPADYTAQFNTDYPEPRAYVGSQAWWLEGAGDVTISIADAMRASHLHYETCFPFMEQWDETSGSIRLDVTARAHEYRGGQIRAYNGLGFLDNFSGNISFQPPWHPTSVDEHRYITLTRATSTLKRCGRVETRRHLEGISPNGGERHFSSTGWQSLFECKPGRSNSSDRSAAVIFRGWYVGGDYANITFTDDFRGSTGFRASEMSVLVVGDLRLKFSLAQGANRWLVALNPNIHAGSFGTWKLSGTGTSATVTIPDAAIPTGVFRVLIAGCERLGSSSANPNGGQNCGVGVLPFRGDGAAFASATRAVATADMTAIPTNCTPVYLNDAGQTWVGAPDVCERVRAGGGNDQIWGDHPSDPGGMGDRLYGEGGADDLFGDGGTDLVIAGCDPGCAANNNYLSGGAGNDTLGADDDKFTTVRGGNGSGDVAFVDPGDDVSGVETCYVNGAKKACP